MTSHNRVVQAVKQYFEDCSLKHKTISTEELIAFGSQEGGIADVVLQSNKRYVAIAECKNPWDSIESAKAQLKSYLCATGTLLGVLAIGRNPKNWVFCENQGNYYFREISKEDFEAKVFQWIPKNTLQHQADTARQWQNTARQIQKSIRKWQVTTGTLAFLFTVSAVVLSILLIRASSSLPSTDELADRGTLYQVSRIIDGDTVEIEYDGVPTSVQLIGVNAPETVHPSKPPEKFGKEATAFVQYLLLHKSVYLKFDGDKKDRYNRLLAYIYRDSDNLFVNVEIIRQGYGQTDTRFPFKYMNLFKYHESQARRERKQIWSQ